MSKTIGQQKFEKLLDAKRHKLQEDELYELLVNYGRRLDLNYSNGKPLEKTIKELSVKNVSKLLELGAEISCGSKTGYNAVYYAAETYSTAIKEVVLKHADNETINSALTRLKNKQSNRDLREIIQTIKSEFNKKSEKNEGFVKESDHIISRTSLIDNGITSITQSFDFETQEVFIKTISLDQDSNNSIAIKSFDEYPVNFIKKIAENILKNNGDDCGFIKDLQKETPINNKEANKTPFIIR